MIPLLFAAALQSEIVLQTNVIKKFSCGDGCHKKVEQLTNMVEIGDSWRKIKVKHTPYMWTREGGLEQRAPVFDSQIGTGGTTSWNYSNCKTNIFTDRRREYFAPLNRSLGNFRRPTNFKYPLYLSSKIARTKRKKR